MSAFLNPLTDAFGSNADPTNAFFMNKYMKGKFEYFGIKTPVRRDITKKFFKEYGFPVTGELDKVVKDCWQKPEREYQYFAMDMLAILMKKAEKDRIGLYEFLVVNKSWWDTVDLIAAKLIGTHFKLYPELKSLYPEKWMLSGNIWLQRTAILFQLHYKSETDLDLLTKFIRELQGSKEFFINKAIGWILREYSKTDAEWVINYVNHNELAPLSKREALKWLERKNN